MVPTFDISQVFLPIILTLSLSPIFSSPLLSPLYLPSPPLSLSSSPSSQFDESTSFTKIGRSETITVTGTGLHVSGGM